MLQPARRKYRKEQKGRNTGIATRGNKVSFGEFGLKAVVRGRLTARQIEAARGADIDYGTSEAKTTYGIIGVKGWVFKGEISDQEVVAPVAAEAEKKVRKSGAKHATAS